MSPDGLSRRRVLAALGAVGAGGLAGGYGTAAYQSDREGATGSTLRAGALDVQLTCESSGCTFDDGGIALSLDDVSPGDAGEESFTLALAGNPGWVWVAAACPEPGLAEAIRVTVTLDPACDGTDVDEISGRLSDVLRRLAAGRAIGTGCLAPETPVCVTVAWEFPVEPGVHRYAGSSVDFAIRFHAVQCRHTGETRPELTFETCVDDRTDGGLSYVEVWTCGAPAPDCACERLGKLELSTAYAEGCPALATAGISENRIEPGLYDLPADDDCADTGFDVRVTATREADGETVGLAFELLDETGAPGPDLCRVVLKSGTDTVIYEGSDLVPRSNASPGILMGPTR